MKWHKSSKLLLVIGQCVLSLKFNDIAIEVNDKLHEQNKKETPKKDKKNQKSTFSSNIFSEH